MPWLGHSVFDAVPITTHAEHMAYILRRRAVPVAWRVAELAAVIGQDCVNLPGFSGDMFSWVKLHQLTLPVGDDTPFQILPVGHIRLRPAIFDC